MSDLSRKRDSSDNPPGIHGFWDKVWEARDSSDGFGGYGCGICVENAGRSETFPSAVDVEQHVKDVHFGRKTPERSQRS